LAAVASRRITEQACRYRDESMITRSFRIAFDPAVTAMKRTFSDIYNTCITKGLINRFAFMRVGIPESSHYYLDNPEALRLLIARGRRSGRPRL